MRNGNFLKRRVSEICVKRIRVNQGLGVLIFSVDYLSGYVLMKTFQVKSYVVTLRGMDYYSHY